MYHLLMKAPVAAVVHNLSAATCPMVHFLLQLLPWVVWVVFPLALLVLEVSPLVLLRAPLALATQGQAAGILLLATTHFPSLMQPPLATAQSSLLMQPPLAAVVQPSHLVKLPPLPLVERSSMARRQQQLG
jgi:hypothetical protein